MATRWLSLKCSTGPLLVKASAIQVIRDGGTDPATTLIWVAGSDDHFEVHVSIKQVRKMLGIAKK